MSTTASTIYVLIADDDIDDTELLSDALNELEEDVEITVVNNGQSVLEQLQKLPVSTGAPCVLVMDMNMPKMDGRETVVAIKNHAHLQNLPILLFSTSKNKTDELFAEKWGVRYFQKPDTVQGLHEVVRVIVNICREGHVV
jgi:CheY-like chemotaxis protein